MSLRRLPSITTLLGLFGALLLIPVLIIAAIQWQGAEERFRAAIEVQDRTERLDSLVRLLVALDDENQATVWSSDGNSLLAELPANIADFIGAGYAVALPEHRNEVDRILWQLGDQELVDRLDRIRRQANGDGLNLASFRALMLDVESDLETELTLLTNCLLYTSPSPRDA